MDAIEKALKKFSEQERIWSKEIVNKIFSGDMKGLDVKKLQGRDDIFRVRKGDIRIIYQKKDKLVFILDIGRRKEKTYLGY
jgi:mRNA-degrading endonuclease RelE of RelBE toxin-antitoxin system